MNKKFYETDLYDPVKQFLTGLGYEVSGEVKSCDIAAIREGELLIVELKKNFNLTLLYQAMDRQDITEQVYVAVPRPIKNASLAVRRMKKIVKKLGLGLITVAMDSPLQYVEVLIFPGEGKKLRKPDVRRSLFEEMEGRRMNVNKGGSSRVKLMTAYRERAIKIACILEKESPLSAKELTHTYGCEKDAYSILYRNPYGWFEKIDKGLYALSPKGRQELEREEFAETVKYYERTRDHTFV